MKKEMLFDIEAGKFGTGTAFNGALGLAKACDMDQLIAIGQSVGVKVSGKGSKAQAAKKIWLTATLIQAGDDRPVAIKKAPKEKSTGKMYVFLKSDKKTEDLSAQCQAILAAVKEAGKADFSKEELKKLLTEKVPSKGNIWTNFNWYRNKVLVPQGFMSK